MEQRKLGSLSVSLVGIGCNNFGWRIDAAGTAAVVDAALDAGINFFDTADMYGAGQSEEFLGKALKGRRDKAIIATKFGLKMGDGMEGARPHYIERALEASLQRLGVEMIDLYQIHRPDEKTPIADTMEALNKAVQAGKVREIGCSNFSAEQMQAARATHGPRYFASVQNEYSLFHREPETSVLPECARTGCRVSALFPTCEWTVDRQVSSGQAASARKPGQRRLWAEGIHRSESGARGAVDRLRGVARTHAAGTGVLMAGGAGGSCQYHRGRREARTSPCERASRVVETNGSRSSRVGRDIGRNSLLQNGQRHGARIQDGVVELAQGKLGAQRSSGFVA
jgi:aryl-alcohol dehydrogenase-like predicted oxidoreductase